MNFSKIKNIIFDLGNVVIDIDFDLTFGAFAKLMNVSLEEATKRMEALRVYDRVERGEFTDEEFSSFLKEGLGLDNTHEEIIEAWNSLLLELPAARVDLIQDLNVKYGIYCLSNTSHPHIVACNHILRQSTGIGDLKHIFDTAYFSYEIAMRKPDLEIYEFVLKDIDALPEEVLFLDDNLDNIKAAASLGIQTIHVDITKNETILDYLKDA